MARLEHITEPITIQIDRTPKVYEQADEIEQAWQALCAQNPRYFNGSMLAFDSYDAGSGVIHARAEQYKHHAVRDEVDTGISLLAVTALLAAPGPSEDSSPVYMLGKRSSELHRYGDLWELGPCGGVDVPSQRDTLTAAGIWGEIEREIREEIGVMVSSPAQHPIALVHDDAVGSTDIVIPIKLQRVPAVRTNWEYTDTRWVSLDELIAWIESSPSELIPTTATIARHLAEIRARESED